MQESLIRLLPFIISYISNQDVRERVTVFNKAA